jgi:glycosyltransferase involved in cell wall biosynthesis
MAATEAEHASATRRAHSDEQERRVASAAVLVSVVVPVRDGAATLRELVAALERQTLPRERFEVVIADDGSKAPPEQLASGGRVRVLAGPPTNSYAARNRGAAASRGEILAFCDADCVPEPDWLERGLAALEHSDVVAGRFRFVVPESRTVWTLLDMDSSKDHELLVRLGIAETANLFLRRETFDRVGGFDGTTREHGDFDFVERCVQAGACLAYADDAVVWHPARTTAKSLFRAHWIYSRGYAERRAMHRRQVEGLKLRTWIPGVSVIRARRRNGLPLTLATPWLKRNGVDPTGRERLGALPLMYLVMPYWRNLAQIVGAVAGVRRRREPGDRTTGSPT